ncbi:MULTISPECIES: ABC transporter permease [Modicisalibacter]|uniref:ABC transporter permease n=1 Tax=Modicisalibacter TaxID=574347 RepID=UPI001CC994DA|nr:MULTISPECIES: ABC transporter permease [Modicisalibacter]MBZ9538895.1 ABC transporter permease [Modicisalibacter tunisiensis]MBZ9559602.1 ABC transporter permease [Modicisalibacter sp. R2A 31.J]MBZ9577054.1 ABC transporter permease [Modicisalibacter sp. MOD 31.J]
MITYAFQRLLLSALIVAVAMSLLIVMLHVVPGDPATMILGPRATPELIAQTRAEMGLDQPLPIQVLDFFGRVLRGDLGTDVFTGRAVGDIVFGQLPYTLVLIAVSIAWSAALGILLGCYSALRAGTWLDTLAGIVSVGTLSIPAFVMSLYAVLIFAVGLGWLPAIGAGEGGVDGLVHLILPAFAIGISWVGYVARMVRASMLEVMSAPHVRMGRAFGLTQARIVRSYILRIAVQPAVTLLGTGVVHLFSAAVFVEVIFARPGIGALIVSSVNERNYPIVLGAVLVTTVIIVLATLVSDLVVALLDPRQRDAL